MYVRVGSSNTLLFTHLFVHSQLRSKPLPTLLNVTVRAPHHLSPLSPPHRTSPDCRTRLHIRPRGRHQVRIPQKYCCRRPVFLGRHSSSPTSVLDFLCCARKIRRVDPLTAKHARPLSSARIL